MMIIKDKSADSGRTDTRRTPNLLWLIVITLVTVFMAGIAAGYLDGRRDGGADVPPGIAGAGLVVLLGLGVLALYLRRFGAFWQSWSPRRRKYWIAFGLASLLGGIIGAWMGADQHGGPATGLALLSNSPLSANFAIGASILWLVGMAVCMFIYHRAIDDHEERAWLWACTASWYSFMFAAPVWWVMHRASLAPPADAMLMFVVSLVVNAIVYLWFKFR